jgi:hypothetical protein
MREPDGQALSMTEQTSGSFGCVGVKRHTASFAATIGTPMSLANPASRGMMRLGLSLDAPLAGHETYIVEHMF